MSTKNKRKKIQKVVKGIQSGSVTTKPILDDSHAIVDDASLSKSSVSTSVDYESNAKKEKSTKQSTGEDSKNSIGSGSTLEDDIKWCIAQLEIAVVSKSVTKKQKEESIKYIKLLQSSKTPVPRKRQIMRQNFGDYKQKMRERPLLDNDIGLKVADPELTISAGKFHRKSTKLFCANDKQEDDGDGLGHHSDSHTLSDLCKELEGSHFTFNFSID